MLLGDYSFDRMRVNCSLTNSAWTANWIEDVYGIRASVLYPPAPGDYRNTPWEQRENGVLCIGRLARAKRADWILQQLLPLRSRIQDLHFHIIGNRSLIKGDPEYFRRLTTLVAENKDWVTLHENISREQLAELASRQRYGIHAAKTEHFGIAVAEMVRAGCVPIVHNSGGQVEIVGNDPLLTFDDPQLAERLLYLTSHPDEVKELRSMLACQAELLTPESFMRGTRRVVKQLLASAGDESLLGAQCSVLHS
jgi:glycosyltransferase involved in cell wall biosynthesis